MSTTLLPPALASLLLLAAPALAGEPQPEVEVSLVSDAGPLEAGATFEVAALFEIEEEWHIYWRDPGETGMATTATLTVPDGFEATGPFFPAPEIVPLAGGLTSYAYHEQVALFFRVTAPDPLPAGGSLKFALSADWLVCKEACFLGDGTARLELDVATGGKVSADQAQALEHSRARMPQPLSTLTGSSWAWGVSRYEEESRKHMLALDVRLPSAQVTFIADATGGLALRRSSHDTTDGTLHLVFECRGKPDGKTARGVLILTTDEGTRFFSLQVPVGASPSGH